MKKLHLLILFNFLFLIAGAQTVVVKGKVKDYDGVGIKNAKVYFHVSNQQYTTTNLQGEFLFKTELKQLDSIVVKHFGYQSTTLEITPKIKRNLKTDTLTIDITLNDIQLGEVVVSFKPKKVFGTQAYSIADFEMLENGNIVLLTYEKTQKKGSVLRLMDSLFNELDRYRFNETTVELKKDFRSNLHLICKEAIYFITFKNDMFLVYPEDQQYYFQYVNPILDTINDKIYYSNYSDLYPAFNYIEFNQTDSVYKTMIAVVDEPMMEQYRAEFKFSNPRTQLWAHRKQIETGIDKEIWVGASVFTQTLYYEPLYAPLFVKNDSVLIFDHYKNYLFKYTPEKGMIDSVTITYHLSNKKNGWEQPLIQDQDNGEVYALFMRNGYTYLSKIDLKTGDIQKSYKLYYKYIENLQIINHQVYYIYRPFESIQKKYLYKENLPQ
jgi:hypothetical protein